MVEVRQAQLKILHHTRHVVQSCIQCLNSESERYEHSCSKRHCADEIRERNYVITLASFDIGRLKVYTDNVGTRIPGQTL